MIDDHEDEDGDKDDDDIHTDMIDGNLIIYMRTRMRRIRIDRIIRITSVKMRLDTLLLLRLY